MGNIKQSDGTSFKPAAFKPGFKPKPLPKAFANFKNAAYKAGNNPHALPKSAPFKKASNKAR